MVQQRNIAGHGIMDIWALDLDNDAAGIFKHRCVNLRDGSGAQRRRINLSKYAGHGFSAVSYTHLIRVVGRKMTGIW